jgi:hypothetical protein
MECRHKYGTTNSSFFRRGYKLMPKEFWVTDSTKSSRTKIVPERRDGGHPSTEMWMTKAQE